MQAPAKPENEEARIDTLYSLNILDTPPEERFDRLTRLARRVFQVPVSLVNLVDEHRIWSKSAQGMERIDAPRDLSFCAHAILGDGILVVTDATKDERFSDNPAVTGEPKVRFYAGCPLRAPNGDRLGTLCLIDQKPRDFSDEDRALLRDLAGMAERELAVLQLATMDELTMLANRRGFEALSEHALELSRRFKKPAALAYFDLNELKQINDQFGHAEGDRALKTFAQLLRLTFRESDVLGRLGEDEFAAFMTNVSNAELDGALERLEKAIDDYNDKTDSSYDIEFSYGKVTFDASGTADVSDLMAQADALKYQNKKKKNA